MVRAVETFQEAAAEAVARITEPGFHAVGEVSPPAAALLLAHAFVSTGRTLCVIVPDARRADELVGDLRVVLGEEDGSGAPRRVHAFEAWDILPYEEALPDREIVGERMAALSSLASGEPSIVVATAASALQKTLPPDHAALRATALVEGQTLERDVLVEALLAAGYRRVDVVEDVGECAVRVWSCRLGPTLHTDPLDQ